jgi:GT2 family glycosyltransferase
MIRDEFPDVSLICNDKNIGFSKANNLALEESKGKYVLFLNPDTIVMEDTLELSFRFAESADNFGALGVKMIDGAGNFHPESKRGFPTIWNSFCRMSGLFKLFPTSKKINGYYQGNLSENKIAEIEVLCGAFFFASNSLIKEIGGFDEDYFMYGEDIDLSYQVKKREKKIYYYPETSIIHFKGESGKKLDSTYLKSFYGAMLTFLKKNSKSKVTKLLLPFLSIAILVKASITVINRVVGKYIWLLIDFILLINIILIVKNIWAVFYYKEPNYFDSSPVVSTIYIFSFIWVCGLYIGGKYDNKYKIKSVFLSYVLSSFLIFSIYALLPEELRSSRFLNIVGLLAGLVIFPFSLAFKNYITGNSFSLIKQKKVKIITVGSKKSSVMLGELISRNNEHAIILGNVNTFKDGFSFGIIDDLETIVKELRVDEIIFSSSDVENQQILTWMSILGHTYSFKISSIDNFSLLSSNSSKKQGEISTLDIDFNINEQVSRRIKRIFDFFISLVLILLSPLLLLFRKISFLDLSNMFLSLVPKKTLISYHDIDNKLPTIKPGVFYLENLQTKHKDNLKYYYAKNYSLLLDFEYLIKILASEKQH